MTPKLLNGPHKLSTIISKMSFSRLYEGHQRRKATHWPRNGPTTGPVAPWKINMDPKSGGSENDVLFKFQLSGVWVSMSTMKHATSEETNSDSNHPNSS